MGRGTKEKEARLSVGNPRDAALCVDELIPRNVHGRGHPVRRGCAEASRAVASTTPWKVRQITMQKLTVAGNNNSGLRVSIKCLRGGCTTQYYNTANAPGTPSRGGRGGRRRVHRGRLRLLRLRVHLRVGLPDALAQRFLALFNQ